MKSSLSRNFLLGVGVTSVAFTIIASLTAFAVFQRELAHRQISFLSEYVQERTDNLSRGFTGLLTLQHSAAELLAQDEKRLSADRADALLTQNFPLQADGTRRSRPEAFDGSVSPGGGLVYGMAAFIADAAHITEADKRVLASAYTIVSTFGPAAHGDYDNFYFFTPHNRLLMFGPDRPDHLLGYRKTAPASLDFSREEMSRIVQPRTNPQGETRCTSLQRQILEKAAARVGLACLTPAYVDGRFVGAFGSTLSANALFEDALLTRLPGASSMVIEADGRPIAYPGSMSKAGANESEVAAYSRRFKESGLPALLRRNAATHGVVVSPDGKQIVAFDRMKGPDWYFLVCYPAAAVTWSAARSASFILLLGLLGCILQTMVIVRMARRAIVQPLQQLARSCETGAASSASQALEVRLDEIGTLARALRGERDRADELFASLEQRVSERTAELEKANAEKSRFLANMSHELRTPLNGVIAVSETLEREQVSPRNVELAQLIVASGRLLERVLTDILDFSKIEAGEMRLESQPFELGQLVGRVAELHRASAQAKGVMLELAIAPEVLGTYLGDSVRLTQVLSNLLSNGVKFTSAGQVELRVDRAGEALRFAVTDSGIGFDEAVKTRLFHRFEQADVSIRRRFGGTGLGLAICRSLVSLMGGEIDATSTPGEGACFTVLLPLARIAAASAEAPVEALADPAELPGLHVLLAEDHPTNQRVVRLILEAVGVELSVVENGALALDAFGQARFDLVLMDMQMPEMDGLTATAELRALEAARGLGRTPVIMLTANALDEHVSASLAAGADLHLSKPLRAAELLDAIAALTGGAEQPGDRTSAEAKAA